MAANSEIVYLVPHTHWDREWYEPFQRFRLRLVDLLDDVIARAETDPAFRFTLDGQMAAVDDYLEVHPENTERVAALVRGGQLAIGPWSVLADEFLCSGENLVRNLERGLTRAAELGGGMPVGYLPDQFGHCAQMPQLLAGAGIGQACLWRGVPAEVARHAFGWQAPDGTTVRCEYLPGGYGNAAYLLADPDRVPERTVAHTARMRSWFGEDPILAMYGTDHSAPLPTLMHSVAALEASTAPVRLRVATLGEYLACFADGTGGPAAVDGLPTWAGELRSHARANILPGVISCRVHLKQALAAAERMVERYAEPLAALWSPAWPQRFLDMAWARLVDSSCHDSVTGCGADATAEQVAARIAEAEQLGSAVRDRVLTGLAARTPSDAVLVVNPSPAPRTGLVALTVPVPEQWDEVALELPDGARVATQPVTRNERTLLQLDFAAAELAPGLLRRSFGQEVFGRRVRRLAVRPESRDVTVEVGRLGDPGFDMDGAAERLDVTARETGGVWTLRVVEEPLRTLYAMVPAPPLGHLAVRPVPGPGDLTAEPVRVDAGALDNNLLRVEVEALGTLRMRAADGTALAGVGRIVDGGDVGDLYNYAPPLEDRLVTEPDAVTVELERAGPLAGALTVTRTYRWPADHRDRCTGPSEPIEVRMRVELRAGERFCRLDVGFDNRCPDHRVRLHVPLARAADRSHAEGQYAVVTRGLTSEGGHGEEPVPTFPAYGFVDAGGAAVLLDHVTEYEVVGEAELALTLLRATGQISRSVHPYRVEPAGPEIATPRAQCLGPVRTRLAVLPHAEHWSADEVLAAAESFHCDFPVVPGTAAAGGPLAGSSGLRVRGDGVVMTSLRRRGELLEMRLVALHPRPTVAVVDGVGRARRADLLGGPGAGLAVTGGQVRLPLRPWEIATLQLGDLES